MATKKLIEVALPLEKINSESEREKHITQGHPAALHLWWARRPLSAARAVIWASIIDDPSSHPELFPTEDEQNKERQRLFRILEQLVVWENSNNESILEMARAEIRKNSGEKELALLDLFTGGGAIPYEAQRLGLKAYAHDLNPVAVTINKAMIEIPARFNAHAPINPDSRKAFAYSKSGWNASHGLAKDVQFYGNALMQRTFEAVGHLYPKVKLPSSKGGKEVNVVAWVWARTVKCSNPACGCTTPLIRSFAICKKKGNESSIHPFVENGRVHYKMDYGKKSTEGTIGRTGAKCVVCGANIPLEYIRTEGKEHRIGNDLIAIIADGPKGKVYLEPNIEHEITSRIDGEVERSFSPMPDQALGFRIQPYGIGSFVELYTDRQYLTLSQFCDALNDLVVLIEKDAIDAGMANDHIGLAEGGKGALAYAQAIKVYLSFAIDKLADYNSTSCTWHVNNQQIAHTFGRQAIPMTWDYTEANPFSGSCGSFESMMSSLVKCIDNFADCSNEGKASQQDAQTDCGIRDVIISTDPPYYDNIGYADLSDYFYLWMRRSLKDVYPQILSTMMVPKSSELIANPFRNDDSMDKAQSFFEKGMLDACKAMYQYTSDSYPVTIYYAYKQSESETVDDHEDTASTGWETMLSAIINAGFSITGTWPIRTEKTGRLRENASNALATSIVLVCRKRSKEAPTVTRRNFINELKRELKPALIKLQNSSIAPVDLAQSAIGPGMGVFSKYNQVLDADGTPMRVRSALKIINQELDLYFNEQDGELDTESRFCVDLYSQMAFNEMPFGDANTLATAKNTSVAIMVSHGTLYAQKGKVHLIERPELPTSINEHEGSIWLLCQQLTYKMEKEGIEGCAAAIANMYGSNAERAKDLAYRLYTIAERKKWAQEAYAYNALVVAWPEIQSRAAELKAIVPQQLTLEDFMNNNN